MNCNIYFINLDKRTDRKKEFLGQFKTVSYDINNIIRVTAIKHNVGTLGCLSSHIKCLKIALQDKYEYAIICEDDFTFHNKKLNFNSLLSDLINSDIDWNVMLMSQNMGHMTSTKNPNIKKIQNSQTTSGYIIKKTYIRTLLSLWENLLEITKNYKKVPHELVCDIYWKKIQKNKWYITNPILGYQRKSYSDIEKCITNYNC